MAYKRLSTIVIGECTALAICILVCPVWAGEDLHNSIANNIDKLGTFLEGFGGVYFKTSATENEEKKEAMEGYRSVLNTKSTDEVLANFAKWEPQYGRFKYRHPWDQYLKIGAHISTKIREKLEEPCKKVSMECDMALKELATTIDSMTTTPNIDIHTVNAKSTAKTLKSLLKLSSWKDNDMNFDLCEIVEVGGIVSLLLEILKYTLKIGDSVSELASPAKFRKIHGIRKKSLQRTRSTDNLPHIVINIE